MVVSYFNPGKSGARDNVVGVNIDPFPKLNEIAHKSGILAIRGLESHLPPPTVDGFR